VEDLAIKNTENICLRSILLVQSWSEDEGALYKLKAQKFVDNLKAEVVGHEVIIEES
jgi:hypothetical protein